MIKDTEKLEELKIATYNLIADATKHKPIKGKTLCFELNLSFRLVKQIITELRNKYPIVSKETDGGGYWLAKDSDDIARFIKMIDARKNGYEDTITKMKKFLDNDFEVDSNHIPYID